ncbi:MAG TPA: helix-turn-helix transcriptional regulator [Candidatus Tumulicola sp.]|nr:helix-turn-helix transcriptional regulator [Candidatus Tumulicola sp.]
MLDLGERHRFGGWIDAARSAFGISKSRLATELHHDSIAQVNKYLRGEVFPTPSVVRKIAAALGIPRTMALVEAGYLNHVMRMLRPVYSLGLMWAFEDNPERVSPRRGLGKPFYLLGHRRTMELIATTRYVGVDHDSQTYLVPRPVSAVVHLALGCFPRRGDVFFELAPNLVSKACVEFDALFEETESDIEMLRAPIGLRSAERILGNWRLPRAARIAMSAEAVQFWVESNCAPCFAATRRVFYKAAGDLTRVMQLDPTISTQSERTKQ